MKKLLFILILLLCYNISLDCQIKDEKIANKTEITKRINTNQFYFLENKGQWDDKVLFMAQSKSLRTWITKNSIVFEQFEKRNPEDFRQHDTTKPKPIKAHAVGLEFVEPSVVNAKKGEAGPTKFNFIIGNDKSKHKSGVLQYSEVSIENIYEGIDMRYYFDNGEFRYDFIVKPGADPGKIEMEIKGSDNFYIKDGDVVMETSLEPVIQKGLNAYQDNKQKKVDCKFKLKDNKLKFEIGEYDKSKELIIDPLSVISKHFVSSGENECVSDIAIDEYGMIYFIGKYPSSDFPHSEGYSGYIGDYDIIIGKLNDNLNEIWVTFFGSEKGEYANSLEVDENYLYFCGYVNENNEVYPTKNAY